VSNSATGTESMQRSFGLVFTLVCSIVLALGSIPEAQAKRFGGGGSFGGKSAFSAPAKRQLAPPVRSAKQQRATTQNQTARQDLAKRGGLMGLLGGLAIGGLLGALIFGGAFENINMMDILIFGAIAFMLYKLLAARAGRQTPRPATYSARTAQPGSNATDGRDSAAHTTAPAFDSSTWFRGGQSPSVPPGTAAVDVDADFNQASIPAGFDEQGFLAGARIAFRELQQAWDVNDLAAIRALTTGSMFAEIQERIRANDAHNLTDVLKVEAELLDAREVGDVLEAVVLFDAIMREHADEEAHQVREVWHFTKPVTSRQPKWFLDGIQQLED